MNLFPKVHQAGAAKTVFFTELCLTRAPSNGERRKATLDNDFKFLLQFNELPQTHSNVKQQIFIVSLFLRVKNVGVA